MSFVNVALISGGSSILGGLFGRSASKRQAAAMDRATQAAREAAQLQYNLGQEALAFQKQHYNEVIKPAADFDMETRRTIVPTMIQRFNEETDFARQQREDYIENWKPVEEQVRQDALGYDSQGNIDRRMGIAAANVNQQYSNAQGQSARALTRMGLNPNSSAFARANANLVNQQALGAAGAQTGAAFDTIDRGIALRAGAANFGRNMPNASAAFGQLANQSGNTAASTTQGGVASGVSAGNFMSQGFNNAGQLNYMDGAMDLGSARIAQSAAQAQAQGVGQIFSGIGNAYGMYAGRRDAGGVQNPAPISEAVPSSVTPYAFGDTSYADALAGGYIPMADGGSVGEQADQYIRGMSARMPAKAPITAPPIQRFADGGTPDGVVKGPGGPRDDMVPAMLSRGEFVLNEGAVKHFGEDRLRKMNEVGLQNQARRGLLRSA